MPLKPYSARYACNWTRRAFLAIPYGASVSSDIRSRDRLRGTAALYASDRRHGSEADELLHAGAPRLLDQVIPHDRVVVEERPARGDSRRCRRRPPPRGSPWSDDAARGRRARLPVGAGRARVTSGNAAAALPAQPGARARTYPRSRSRRSIVRVDHATASFCAAIDSPIRSGPATGVPARMRSASDPRWGQPRNVFPHELKPCLTPAPPRRSEPHAVVVCPRRVRCADRPAIGSDSMRRGVDRSSIGGEWITTDP